MGKSLMLKQDCNIGEVLPNIRDTVFRVRQNSNLIFSPLLHLITIARGKTMKNNFLELDSILIFKLNMHIITNIKQSKYKQHWMCPSFRRNVC